MITRSDNISVSSGIFMLYGDCAAASGGLGDANVGGGADVAREAVAWEAVDGKVVAWLAVGISLDTQVTGGS